MSWVPKPVFNNGLVHLPSPLPVTSEGLCCSLSFHNDRKGILALAGGFYSCLPSVDSYKRTQNINSSWV